MPKEEKWENQQNTHPSLNAIGKDLKYGSTNPGSISAKDAPAEQAAETKDCHEARCDSHVIRKFRESHVLNFLLPNAANQPRAPLVRRMDLPC